MAFAKRQDYPERKVETVTDLRSAFAEHPCVIVTQYKGMTVKQMGDMRRKMREVEITWTVAKNTLAKLAIANTPFEGISPMLKGPTAIAFAKDPVKAGKMVLDAARTNDKFVIVGAGFGPMVLTGKDEVEKLTTLPTLDDVRAKILGLLIAPSQRIATITAKPAQQIVTLMTAPQGKLARVFAAYGAKAEGGDAAAAA